MHDSEGSQGAGLGWWRWAAVFRPAPHPWGLRGDPFAWQSVEAVVTARGVPAGPAEAAVWLHEALAGVLGVADDVSLFDAGRDEWLVDRFDHGGISSGHVHLPSWRDRFLPALNGRVERLFATGGADLAHRYRAFRELAGPFAEAIAAKRALLDLTGPASEVQRRRVKESISDDLRKLTDIVAGTVIDTDVSEAAAIIGVSAEVLAGQTWHTQPSVDPARELFRFEHVTPIESLRAGCLQATTAADMVGFLWRHARCAWILKAENAALNRLGYSKVRALPLDAYSHAGIQLYWTSPDAS